MTIPGMNEEIVSGILAWTISSILEYDSIGMDYGIEQLSLIEGINEELAIRIMNSARNHCNLRISQPPRLATERNGGLEECDRIYKHLRNFDMQPMLDPFSCEYGTMPTRIQRILQRKSRRSNELKPKHKIFLNKVMEIMGQITVTLY